MRADDDAGVGRASGAVRRGDHIVEDLEVGGQPLRVAGEQLVRQIGKVGADAVPVVDVVVLDRDVVGAAKAVEGGVVVDIRPYGSHRRHEDRPLARGQHHAIKANNALAAHRIADYGESIPDARARAERCSKASQNTAQRSAPPEESPLVQEG